MKFPVISLFIREFIRERGSNETVSSANESFSVCNVAKDDRNPRVRGRFRTASGSGDAPAGGFCRFLIGFIRGNQIRGHDENGTAHGSPAVAYQQEHTVPIIPEDAVIGTEVICGSRSIGS